MGKDYDFDELYPGRFLKAAEFNNRDVTYTITGVDLEELEGNKGKQMKGIVTFNETKKALALNKTNGICLKAMFGRRTGAWVGKRVTFYPAPIDFEDVEICIRVRGSPDIPAQLQVEIKLPRKKPRTVVMQKTGAGNGAPAAPSVYERIVIICTEYGVPKSQLGPEIKAATGKTNGRQLTEDDVAKVVAHLEGLKTPPPMGTASEPPMEDDVPL